MFIMGDFKRGSKKKGKERKGVWDEVRYLRIALHVLRMKRGAFFLGKDLILVLLYAS